MKNVGRVQSAKDIATREYTDIRTKVTLFEDVTVAGSTIYVDGVKPLLDKSGREGWHFKNDWTSGTSHLTLANFPQYGTQANVDALCKTKINWYFFDGNTTPSTWANFKYAYAVVTIDGDIDKYPYFYFYSSYSPLTSYTFSVKTVTLTKGKTYLMWFGNEEPSADVFPLLPRVRFTKNGTQPSNTDNVLSVAYSTNSASAQNGCELQTYNLGFKTAANAYNFDLKISGSGQATGIAKLTGDVPSGSTQAVITHNLNTKDVTVSVRTSATDDFVVCDIKASSTSQVTITFDTAPTNGEYKYVIIG